jgi:putative transposase
VERNPLRAHLVARAEDWRWSSLWRRLNGAADEQALLAKWPLPTPRGWTGIVNRSQPELELTAIRRSLTRGCPYGSAGWTARTVRALGLESTLRPRGRPRKTP